MKMSIVEMELNLDGYTTPWTVSEAMLAVVALFIAIWYLAIWYLPFVSKAGAHLPRRSGGLAWWRRTALWALLVFLWEGLVFLWKVPAFLRDGLVIGFIALHTLPAWQAIPEFDLLLLGDVGVGKALITTLVFHPIRGPIQFNVRCVNHRDWSNNALSCGDYIGCECAIIMFDHTSLPTTYKNVPNWHRDLTRACGNIPIVLVGSNADSTKVKKWITLHKKKNLPYYPLSVKSSDNLTLGNLRVLETPFLLLASKMTGDNPPHFVEAPVLLDQQAQIDDLVNRMEKLQRENDEMKEQLLAAAASAAAAVPLPEGDDEDL